MGGTEGSGDGSGRKEKHLATHDVCFRGGKHGTIFANSPLANHYDTNLHVSFKRRSTCIKFKSTPHFDPTSGLCSLGVTCVV